MKKSFALAIVLACALSSTSVAGIIHSTDEPAPEIHTTGGSSPSDVPSTDPPSPGDVPGVDLSIVLTITDLLF